MLCMHHNLCMMIDSGFVMMILVMSFFLIFSMRNSKSFQDPQNRTVSLLVDFGGDFGLASVIFRPHEFDLF